MPWRFQGLSLLNACPRNQLKCLTASERRPWAALRGQAGNEAHLKSSPSFTSQSGASFLLCIRHEALTYVPGWWETEMSS